MLYHGEKDGDDVGEDGEDGGQPGDEDAIRFFVYVYEILGFGPLKDEGVEEVGIGHLCLLMAIKAATTQTPILQTKRKKLPKRCGA